MLKGIAMINDKRTILVGLDGPAMDTLLKGVTAFVVNVEDMEELKDEARDALRDARSKNAMNGPPMRPPVGRLVRSRAGGRIGISSFRRN